MDFQFKEQNTEDCGFLTESRASCESQLLCNTAMERGTLERSSEACCQPSAELGSIFQALMKDAELGLSLVYASINHNYC